MNDSLFIKINTKVSLNTQKQTNNVTMQFDSLTTNRFLSVNQKHIVQPV